MIAACPRGINIVAATCKRSGGDMAIPDKEFILINTLLDRGDRLHRHRARPRLMNRLAV